MIFFQYKGYGIELSGNGYHIRVFTPGHIGNSSGTHNQHQSTLGFTLNELRIANGTFHKNRCGGVPQILLKSIDLWGQNRLDMGLEDYLKGLDLDLSNEH